MSTSATPTRSSSATAVMHPAQAAYAVAKAALQAAIECMAAEEATCPFEEGSDEYYAFGEALSAKYDYSGLYDALRAAEENMMVWAHGQVMKQAAARKHKADVELVFEARNRLVTVRHKLIDLAFRLSA